MNKNQIITFLAFVGYFAIRIIPALALLLFLAAVVYVIAQ